ncbi:cupin domain-containing protein [Subtercola sp. YIM 133946]|uniref:cupin domain-containing protein n=1 Tax=Subtercola sp. YIM 133946 TaxID=3118909 RepID=UPI002F946CAA
MSGAAPVIRNVADLPGFLISPDDTVVLAELAGPAQGSSTSVFLEIWRPGGAQPLNSHAESAEIFIVLAGTAEARSDDAVVPLVPGDVLTLQPGSEHRIVNASATEKLYTITIMANDGGFSELVTGGTRVPLAADDLGALVRSLGAA